MEDQYENEVPDDLVSLDCGIDRFNDEELKIITNARWYEVWYDWGADLMVSFSEIDGIIDDWYLLEGTPIKILLVNDILKRWSAEDGFYHA